MYETLGVFLHTPAAPRGQAPVNSQGPTLDTHYLRVYTNTMNTNEDDLSTLDDDAEPSDLPSLMGGPGATFDCSNPAVQASLLHWLDNL